MLKRWSIGSVVIALVILSVVPAASAGSHATDRPFKASFAGQVHWEWPGVHPSECVLVTTVTDSFGKATHMGRTESLWSHCPEGDSNHEPNDGHITLIAANGDELYGVYDYPAIDDGSPIVFTGGTGRFANASGSATVVYDVNPEFVEGCPIDPDDPFPCMDFSVPWQWSSTLTGTISY